MEDWAGLSTAGILKRGAERYPEKTAVVDGERREGYREIEAMSDALAAALQELGYRKGDRVAVYMKNSLEFITAFYALQKLGVIVAWANPNYRVSEAQFILRNSRAKGVFLFREWEGYDYLTSLLAMREELPDLEGIFVVGDGEGEGVYRFDEMLKRGKGKRPRPTAIDVEHDLSMLIYTSGTTGRPKGAMITHMQAVRAGMEYSRGVNAGPDDVFIGFLPMSHSYGCGSILIQPLLLGSTLVVMDKFDPKRCFDLIARERVTLQLGAPAHYILELSRPDRKQYDLSSLRAGLIAGQIAPEGLIRRVQEEMGVYITSFWGASEVGPGVGLMCPYPSPLDIREKYVGLPVAGTQVRAVDPGTRSELPDGQIGELTLSGWHVMKGYWNNPEETAKQVVDGWLYMGDLVSREEGGYIRIFGRTKDLINRGGFKVYSYELETLLADHPKVEEVSVVATPNPVLGESICACIVPKAGETVHLSEIRSFLAEKIAPYKLPDELCIMDRFPRLSGGVKINKFGKGGVRETAMITEGRERHRTK
jgi:acyl-CoA synthetase (AMP-forming)/AMP-acid ligase II